MNNRFEFNRNHNGFQRMRGDSDVDTRVDDWPVRLAPRNMSMKFATEELFDADALGPPIGVRFVFFLFCVKKKQCFLFS